MHAACLVFLQTSIVPYLFLFNLLIMHLHGNWRVSLSSAPFCLHADFMVVRNDLRFLNIRQMNTTHVFNWAHALFHSSFLCFPSYHYHVDLMSYRSKWLKVDNCCCRFGTTPHWRSLWVKQNVQDAVVEWMGCCTDTLLAWLLGSLALALLQNTSAAGIRAWSNNDQWLFPKHDRRKIGVLQFRPTILATLEHSSFTFSRFINMFWRYHCMTEWW